MHAVMNGFLLGTLCGLAYFAARAPSRGWAAWLDETLDRLVHSGPAVISTPEGQPPAVGPDRPQETLGPGTEPSPAGPEGAGPRSAPIKVQLLTYSDLIAYFVTDRPAVPNVKQGAILRQRTGRRYVIRQMFLDTDDEVVCDPAGVPYGRTIEARDLDEELRESFGDHDLILVQ